MQNAIYKGKIYDADHYSDVGEKSIIIRSKYEQEEAGFLPFGNGRYYKYVSPKEIEAFYSYYCYAVFNNVKCSIYGVADDMSTMAFEERGRTLLDRYKPVSQIENGCYLYENIPLRDADCFEIEFDYGEKPCFDRTVKTTIERYTYQEFVDKYRELVLDV